MRGPAGAAVPRREGRAGGDRRRDRSGRAPAARSRHRLHRRRRVLEGAQSRLPQPPLHRHRDAAAEARRAAVDAGVHPRARRVRAVLQGPRRHRHDLPRARREADAARARARDRHRSDQDEKQRGAGAGARHVQGSDRTGRAAGGRKLLLRDRTRLARSLHLQRALQERRGVCVRARRGAARGISRGGEGGLRPADRRSRAAGLVGHDQAGDERRGLHRQVRQTQDRCAQPRAAGNPRGPRPLSPVLGKLARAAHPRSARSSTSSS